MSTFRAGGEWAKVEMELSLALHAKSMRGDEVLFQNSSISSGPAVSGDAVPETSNNVPSEQTVENRSLEKGNGSQGGGSVGNVDVVTTDVTKSQGNEKGVASHTRTGDNVVKRTAMKRGASEADGNETYKRVEIDSTEKVVNKFR